MREMESIDTVVVGAGQAGLSVGYHLARRGVPFVILDANRRVGDSWRQRWDSLRLFTPARLDGLNGFPFPAPPFSFPTKDQMGDYLEAYAKRFSLPVRTGVRVDRISKAEGGLLVSAGTRRILARNVVVAMADFQRPHVPEFAGSLDESITQFHSSAYRGPGQLRPGGVLLVGLGNSGAEIAHELARAGHETFISGKESGELPFRMDGLAARLFLAKLIFRVVFFRLLRRDTRFGQAALRRAGGKQATPLIRVKSRELAADGVIRVPRTTGVRNGLPLLEDGRTLGVSNVIWCTGYEPGFSWIELPVFDERGHPVQTRGITHAEPGLSFVGLHFLYAMASSMIHGVGRDAEYVAERIAERRRGQPAPQATREPATAVA
jgi:putative flavoprotein involved in K+ transport